MATPADSLPFFADASPDAVVARRGGRPIVARTMLADARRLAARLPATGTMLNACADRYRFTVGLLAALLHDHRVALPNNLVAQTVADLRACHPGLYLLADGDGPSAGDPAVGDLASVRIDDTGIDHAKLGDTGPAGGADAGWSAPSFPADRVAACLFTSGSTGHPVAHDRRWGTIVASARAEAQALGMDGGARWSILGTVPPQHSYGFESTVFLALAGHGALAAEHPFFPADVLDRLAELPAPRLLVTTPVHLRALVGELAALPRPGFAIERVMTATAPLTPELAHDAEHRLGAELVEIYGSTETGQVAVRRPTVDDRWTTLPGVRITLRDDGHPYASDGHVGPPTPLADVIDPLDDHRFVLRGRTADMVNIAGKRSSIAFLDRQLLAIDGIVDGAFYLPDDDPAAARDTRLVAFVVAPGLTDAQLTAALRTRIEAVFLPRPLHRVDALPRDGNGKLPRQRLAALAAALARERRSR